MIVKAGVCCGRFCIIEVVAGKAFAPISQHAARAARKRLDSADGLVPVKLRNAGNGKRHVAPSSAKFNLAQSSAQLHPGGVLRSYQQYYNGTRTHLALAKDSPLTRPVQAIGSILPLPILGGLHHRYIRI